MDREKPKTVAQRPQFRVQIVSAESIRVVVKNVDSVADAEELIAACERVQHRLRERICELEYARILEQSISPRG